MATHRGRFDSNGLPTIEIEVAGQGDRRTITAIIDTGFQGHLSLDYKTAFPLGLGLEALGSSNLADGSSVTHLICRGKVMLGEKIIDSTIDVQPNGKVLVGMKFLEDANLSLRADRKGNVVELKDN